MNRDRLSVEDLRRELDRLLIATRNIERLIQEAEETVVNRNERAEQQRNQADRTTTDRRRNLNYREEHPVVRDRAGIEILIGDQVRFLTSGKHNSTTGVVYKISNNGTRVTARDSEGRSISRAPHNITVITQ